MRDAGPEIDVPALVMVIVFMSNMAVSYLDPYRLALPRAVGQTIFVIGLLICGYVIAYLKSGFLGGTKPSLDRLVTNGPYGFCRHPLYVGFIVLLLGVDLMLGSPLGIAFTFLLSLPSAVHRAKVEDKFLRDRFGGLWEEYAGRVGFMLPKLRVQTRKESKDLVRNGEAR